MKTKLSAVASMILAATVIVACEEKKADTAGTMIDKAADATKDAANKAVDATKDAAAKTGEAVKEGADKATEAAKDAVKEGTDKAKEAAKDATDAAKAKAAELTDAAKSTMNDYLGNLGKLSDTLAGAKDPISGAKAAADAKPLTDKLSGAMAALDKLSPELKTTLKETFKDQLASVTAKYKEQVDRLAKDSTLGKLFGDSLKNLKLFE